MQEGKNTYLVFTPGNQRAESFKADDVVIEPSGALSLYRDNQNEGRILLHAYANGAWQKVVLHVNV